MSNVFFIGDIHLGHKNIINFGQRSFATSLEEHDEQMIQKWNSVVRPKDRVWVLGDVAFSSVALQKVGRLSGEKFLIAGNHDDFNAYEYLKYFKNVKAFEKRYNGLVLTHIPIHPYELHVTKRKWKFNIHGHLHEYDLVDNRYINVNADRINHMPISLDKVRDIIKSRNLVRGI